MQSNRSFLRGLRRVSGASPVAAALMSIGLASCGGDSTSLTPPPPPTAASVGAKIFVDTSMSASGRQSCATCHDLSAGLAAPNALAVQPGGANLEQTGVRNTPSAAYLKAAGVFHVNDQGHPAGGLFWDGRVDTLAAQAAEPLVNPIEMANADHAAVIAKLRNASYADDFRTVFGATVFDDVETAYSQMTAAIAAFETEDPRFNAFSSKFDDVQRGTASFTAAEARGFALFTDPAKGNCAACHPATADPVAGAALFTDHTFINIGVPRNPEIPANADPAYFDLGLCNRPEIVAHQPQACGAFKVPSLRNVALRKSYFHNGRFHTLKDVLTWYAQRDTNPEKFYPVAPDGTVNQFDDVPPQYQANVLRQFPPYDGQPGQQPILTDAEIDDLISFLGTLTDAPAN
jgi:cytochrome c peroxidase